MAQEIAIRKHITAFAELLQNRVVISGLPGQKAYCSCNPTCSCEEKPGCCEGKCPCHTDTDRGSPEDLISNPAYREIVAAFNPEQTKTLEDFQSLVAHVKTRLAGM